MSTAAPVKATPVLKHESFVVRQLGRARQRIRTLDMAVAVLGLLIGTLAYGLGMALCDIWLQPRPVFRQVGFILYAVAAAAYLVVAVIRPLFRRVNLYYAARQVEQALPGAKNSVVNWLDLRDRHLPPAIRGALTHRAAKDLGRADLDQAISARRAGWLGGIAAGLFLGLAVLFFLAGPHQFVSLLGHAFMPFDASPLATRTTLDLVDPEGGDATVPAYHAVAFAVHVGGKVPDPKKSDAIKLRYRHDQNGSYEEKPLEPADDNRTWGTLVPAAEVHNGFWYKITGGDAETPEYRVRVLSSPFVTDYDVTYHFRPYLVRSDEYNHEPNLQAPRGTEVTLLARTNRLVKEGTLELMAEKQLVAANLTDDPHVMRFQFVLDRDGEYRIWFTARDGERNADPMPYRIKVMQDQAPTVRLTKPGKDVTLPANGVLRLEGDATDDHGLTSLTLRMIVNSEEPAQARPYRDGKSFRLAYGNYPQRLDYKDFVDLARVKLKNKRPLQPGMVIEYWLEATDNCDYPPPGPNVGRSTHFKVTIAEAEKEQTRQQQEQQAKNDQQKHEQKQDNDLKRESEQKEEQAARAKEEQQKKDKEEQGKGDEQKTKDQAEREQRFKDDRDQVQKALEQLDRENKKKDEKQGGRSDQENQTPGKQQEGSEGKGKGAGKSDQQNSADNAHASAKPQPSPQDGTGKGKDEGKKDEGNGKKDEHGSGKGLNQAKPKPDGGKGTADSKQDKQGANQEGTGQKKNSDGNGGAQGTPKPGPGQDNNKPGRSNAQAGGPQNHQNSKPGDDHPGKPAGPKKTTPDQSAGKATGDDKLPKPGDGQHDNTGGKETGTAPAHDQDTGHPQTGPDKGTDAHPEPQAGKTGGNDKPDKNAAAKTGTGDQTRVEPGTVKGKNPQPKGDRTNTGQDTAGKEHGEEQSPDKNHRGPGNSERPAKTGERPEGDPGQGARKNNTDKKTASGQAPAAGKQGKQQREFNELSKQSQSGDKQAREDAKRGLEDLKRRAQDPGLRRQIADALKKMDQRGDQTAGQGTKAHTGDKRDGPDKSAARRPGRRDNARDKRPGDDTTGGKEPGSQRADKGKPGRDKTPGDDTTGGKEPGNQRADKGKPGRGKPGDADAASGKEQGNEPGDHNEKGPKKPGDNRRDSGNPTTDDGHGRKSIKPGDGPGAGVQGERDKPLRGGPRGQAESGTAPDARNLKKGSDMQLEDFPRNPSKDLLKQLNWDAKRYQQFIKDRDEVLKSRTPEPAARRKPTEPHVRGGNLGNHAPHLLKGGYDKEDRFQTTGPTHAPADYQLEQEDFSKSISKRPSARDK